MDPPFVAKLCDAPDFLLKVSHFEVIQLVYHSDPDRRQEEQTMLPIARKQSTLR
jgi:hypothetical protein